MQQGRTAARDSTLTLSLSVECPGCFTTGGPIAREWRCTGTVGGTFTIIGTVVDGAYAPAAGVTVNWSGVHGGTTNVSSSVTDSAGDARVQWTLDTIAGADSLRASLSSGATVLGTAIAMHTSPANAFKVRGDSQVVAIGSAAAPFVVRVTDRYGNPVPGFQVAWAATAGFQPIVAHEQDRFGRPRSIVGRRRGQELP